MSDLIFYSPSLCLLAAGRSGLVSCDTERSHRTDSRSRQESGDWLDMKSPFFVMTDFTKTPPVIWLNLSVIVLLPFIHILKCSFLAFFFFFADAEWNKDEEAVCVRMYVNVRTMQPFSPFLSKAAPVTESLKLKKDLKTLDLFILKRPSLLLLLLLFLPLSFLTTPSLHHLQPPLIRSQYCQEIAPATQRERERQNRYIFFF